MRSPVAAPDQSSGAFLSPFGIVLFIRPDIGALSLAAVFGLYAIVYGVSAAVLSFQTRKAGSVATRCRGL